MKPRHFLPLLACISLCGAAEFIYDTKPDAEAEEAIRADVIKRRGAIIAAHPEFYRGQVRSEALGRIFPSTYEAYGIVADEGFVVDQASVDTEIAEVTVHRDYIDLRSISVSVDGEEVETGLWGVYVHYVFSCTYTWRATRGDESREYRSEQPHRLETHHQLFPRSAVAHVFGLERYRGKKHLLINGDLFPRPE